MKLKYEIEKELNQMALITHSLNDQLSIFQIRLLNLLILFYIHFAGIGLFININIIRPASAFRLIKLRFLCTKLTLSILKENVLS